MGYAGQTFLIPFSKGGLFHDPNTDNIPPEMMVDGSRNIDLHENGRGKRGGTAHVNSTVFPGQPRVMGLFDFVLQNGNQFDVVATADGNIYRNETTTIKTGQSVNRQTNFEVMNNDLYAVNGVDKVQVWDGTGAMTDLVKPSPDWGDSNNPKFFIKHGRGNSERIFAFGCPNNPNNLYFSVGNDGASEADFTGDGSGILYIETAGGSGLVGGKEFGDRLILSSKTQAYILDDSSTDIATWGYETVQWSGGVAHGRLLVKTPNDLVAFTEEGDIYSVVATETYGDYKQASIARPAFIDRWIREKCDLTSIADFHSVYDPVLRAIHFFVVRKGQTQVDSALVYYIDRGPREGWMLHDNLTSVSGFSASSSALFRAAVGDFRVYTGGYLGFVWRLHEANENDDGNGYRASSLSSRLPLENMRLTKKYKRGWLGVQAAGSHNLNVNIWIDGVAIDSQAVDLIGTGGIWGTDVWSNFIWGSRRESVDKTFDIGTVGKRIQFEFYNENANENFFISQLLIDHKELAARPAA